MRSLPDRRGMGGNVVHLWVSLSEVYAELRRLHVLRLIGGRIFDFGLRDTRAAACDMA